MEITDAVAVVGLLLLLLGVPGAVGAFAIIWAMRRITRLGSRSPVTKYDIPRERWPEWSRVLTPAHSRARVPFSTDASPPTIPVAWYAAEARKTHREVSGTPGAPNEFEIAATIARARLSSIRDNYFQWSQYDFAIATISRMHRAGAPPSSRIMTAALVSSIEQHAPLGASVYESLGITARTMEIAALVRDPEFRRIETASGISDVEAQLAPSPVAPSPLNSRGEAIWAASFIRAAHGAASHARGRFLTA